MVSERHGQPAALRDPLGGELMHHGRAWTPVGRHGDA
jgi:hypothetical protein